FKSPRLDSFDRLFIQTQSQRACNFDVARFAVRTNDQPEYADALILCLARFLRILGIGLEHDTRCRNTTAYAENATARTTATAFAVSGTAADSNAATRSGSDARS